MTILHLAARRKHQGKPFAWRELSVENRTNDASNVEFKAARKHVRAILPNVEALEER